MKVLVTGTAGFIGNFVAERLLARGDTVVGLDIMTDYYDVALKEDRLKRISGHVNFTEARMDLADREGVAKLFEDHGFDAVVNLAAQAGVRYSIDNPSVYVDSNLTGFANVLEGCRNTKVKHLVFASSSSVYGSRTDGPFKEDQDVSHPISLYAATKKSNELMAHTYAHLYGIPCTGLRFFTVYGPWGRPDMAYFKFAKLMKEGKPIDVYNGGNMTRDFTYIDDIVDGVIRVLDQKPTVNENWNNTPDSSAIAPYRIYNIGNNQPETLMRYIDVLEDKLGMVAEKNMLPMQAGDVPVTWANIDSITDAVGYQPTTTIEQGLEAFAAWFKDYYGEQAS